MMLWHKLSRTILNSSEQKLFSLQKRSFVFHHFYSKTTVVVLNSRQAKSRCFHTSVNKSFKNISSGYKLDNKLNNHGSCSALSVRFYSLPSYNKIVLPALSPTMETGTIVKWQVKEGDRFEPGDLLADIETDKATMGFEAIDEGYIAKILVQEGAKDVPLGTLVAISVDSEEDVAAFKDATSDQFSDDGVSIAPVPSTEKPQVEQATSTAVPPPSTPSPNVNLPVHDRVLLPALSPTMTTGTVVSWEVKEGGKIEEGDPIATIETDKASMALEYQDEGYMAKILAKEGVRDLPLGTPLCIVVPNQSDVAAFANYVETESAPAPAQAAASPLPASTSQQKPAGIPPPIPHSGTIAPKSSGDRLFVSPLAKRLAGERGIDLNLLAGQGSGPSGRIRAQDLSKASAPGVTPVIDVTAPVTPSVEGDFVDIPLSNIRKVTAKRLTESKQTIPHYYLTIDVEMDKVMQLRKNFNAELQNQDVKLSVNDFLIKAASVACLRIPEANSSWRETFIRRHNAVDMSVAVSTDSGLITPIVFNAHSKGLVSISNDVISLAAKAREGKLQPQEYQGGTFTISNLGMFGVKHFSAIINPPQACTLAVGSARKEILPDSSVEEGSRTATVMSVTLSCDHRVVDGAVGAQWLQHFKKYIEDPVKMIL